MNIKILKLKITNFKGVTNLECDFKENTNIYGANATGKTSIFDAYLWVLFGKNHEGKSDFEIKPLDKNNQPIHKLESEVELLLSIDDIHTVLKRTHREKWQKKRGEQIEEFFGNETLFWVDNVPKSSTEYKRYVGGIVDENVFKILSSPEHFNSLSWTDRRSMLTLISGDVTNAEIALGNNEFENLLANLNGKSIEDKKKEISALKRKLKDEIDSIPARIDELYRSMPVVIYETDINKRIDVLNNLIQNIDESIADKSKQYDEINNFNLNINNQISEINNSIYKLKQESILKQQNAYDEENRLFYLKKNEIEKLKQQIDSSIFTKNLYENKISDLQKEIEKLRTKFTVEDAAECSFDTIQLTCPTCKRDFDDVDVYTKKEELKNSFNLQKANKLKAINEQGAILKERITSEKEKLNTIETLLTDLSVQLTELNPDPFKNQNQNIFIADTESYLTSPECVELKTKIDNLKIQLKPIQDFNLQQLTFQKKPLLEEIDTLKKQLNNNYIAEKTKVRIAELDDTIKNANQKIADLENIEFTIDKFIRAKITTIETNINNMFSFVKFKMYNLLVNGSEEPTCETLINGVPYSSANAAAQKNAGIDIINTLSNYYHVTCPIFLDNAESTNSFIDSNCQLIKLFVIEPCPKDNNAKLAYISNYEFLGKLLL